MQLTKQTDFAFRILIYLSQAPEGELQQIQQICDFYDISKNHLSKIVVKLVKLGYVKAQRGKGGGIYLGMKSEAINLADVVKAIEPSLQPVNCDEPVCRITANCKLKGILADSMQAFVDNLAQYHLSDISFQNHQQGNAGLYCY